MNTVEQFRESLRAGLETERRKLALDRELADVESEFRSSLENPQTPLSYPDEWLLDAWNGGRTDSGIRVSEMTSLQVATCYACVDLIAMTIGGLDLNIYEHIDAANSRVGKRLAVDHALFDLLHDEPNEEMSSFTFFRTLQVHALLWSNAYAEIQRDAANRAVAIWPLMPSKTRPYRIKKTGELIYKTSVGLNENSTVGGEERIIAAADMVHIPGLSLDGRVGYGTISLLRQAFGLTLAGEKFAAKFFANNAKPGGVLEHPGKLKPEARETMRRSWQEAQSGDRSHSTAILENGLKYVPITMKPNEGQSLEQRQFQVGQICSIFHVPPHMIGDSEKSNRANTEQLGLEFVSFTLSPWLKNWQSELKRKLFGKIGRNSGRFFPRFDTRPLTMPDATSRQAFYAAGRQWSYLSPNDVRDFEHLNPSEQPGAELLTLPTNIGILGAEGAIVPKPATPPPDPNAPAKDPPEEDPDTIKRFVRSYSGLFRDALGRLSARSAPDTDAFVRAFEPILTSIKTQIVTFGSEAAADDELVVDFDSKEYIRGLQKRVDESRPMNVGLSREQIADREVARAVKAITIETYRALATARAKAKLEETNDNV